MQTKIFAIIAMTTVLALAGCKSAPRTGSVGWGELPSGSLAKDIPYTAQDGTKTTFHKQRAPIAIVAFVEEPQDQCCWVHPGLIDLTQRFENMPVSVAQISAPTNQCPEGPGCMEMCHIGPTRLFSFCDSQQIAWNAYNRPRPGTVFLLDQKDRVVQAGSINDLGPITDKAYKLGSEIKQTDPTKIRREMWFD